MSESTIKIIRQTLHFFPIFALILLFCCSDSRISNNLFSPADRENQPDDGIFQSASSLSFDIRLKVQPGSPPPSPQLAVARDDTTTDSLNLYIDVEIENVGPQVMFLSEEADLLNLEARVTFVDLPYKKNFYMGRLKLVVGWTESGRQASEVHDTEFSADSSVLLRIPLSRVDSFHIGDNVAVYGEVLAPGRFIYAKTVRRFDAATPPQDPAPDLVGFIKSIDELHKRIYVSNATVVITDTTRIENSAGELITSDKLSQGKNEFTITAMAWAYTIGVGMTANGWEFKRFTVYVGRQISQ